MLVTTTAGVLRSALNTARQATPSTPSLLAYSAVQLVVENSSATFIGSDGETTIIASFPVSGSRDGVVLVLPKPLHAFLSSLDEDTRVSCELSSQGDELVVSPAGGNEYRFRTVSSTFPQPILPSGTALALNFTRFATGLTAVRTATSKESPVVQLVSGDEGLALHATDNYRLCRVVLPEAGFGEFEGVLSLPVLDRVAKMVPSKVTIDTRSRVISFMSSETTLVTRLLAVPFPAVDGVVSAVPAQSTSLPAAPLLKACARLASVTEASPVRCVLTSNGLSLNVTNADLGSGTEQIQVSDNNSAGTFEFLARLTYIQDALAAANSPSVRLAFSGPVQPLFLYSEDPVPVLTVVMPVRG